MERLEFRDRLLAQSEEEPDPQRKEITELLAHILEFHRREAKPQWWRHFDRQGMSDEELYDDNECLAGCERTERESYKPTEKTRTRLAHEYRFDRNQEFKLRVGDQMQVLGSDDPAVTAIELDTRNGVITLQSKKEPPSHCSLMPGSPVPTGVIEKALEDIARAYADDPTRPKAILDFLCRRHPRVKGHPGGALICETGDRAKQITSVVERLDNSYLTIQGPPGAGKTYSGKKVITQLVKDNKRIGIASNSHKAINNLLVEVAKHARAQGVTAHCVCTKETGPEIKENDIKVVANGKISGELKDGCAIGATAWGFSRSDLEDELDYLFVDEAGQVSVANLVAMSRSAKNLVLLGDQMQLGQPIQGSHPGKSGLSILEYLLQDEATIPAEMGIFMDITYRMHPAVNRFISDAVYESRLETDPDNQKQVIQVPKGSKPPLNIDAGLVFVPVEHQGNTQASEEEVETITKLASELIGRQFTAKDGVTRPISWQDILFVAPYNHQVNQLQAALGDQAKVGSVDKFQGQQAPIVFLSMCTSNPEESPRGLGFLLDRRRLNVAISRAQSLAIVVGNPRIARTAVNRYEQLPLLNMFAQVIEYGGADNLANLKLFTTMGRRNVPLSENDLAMLAERLSTTAKKSPRSGGEHE